MSERRFCPKCQRLLDYDPYYKAWFCTSCSYRKYDNAEPKREPTSKLDDAKAGFCGFIKT